MSFRLFPDFVLILWIKSRQTFETFSFLRLWLLILGAIRTSWDSTCNQSAALMNHFQMIVRKWINRERYKESHGWIWTESPVAVLGEGLFYRMVSFLSKLPRYLYANHKILITFQLLSSISDATSTSILSSCNAIIVAK